MPLSPEYLAALELLGRVCEKYRIQTGAPDEGSDAANLGARKQD
jgi:hypothetical protein